MLYRAKKHKKGREKCEPSRSVSSSFASLDGEQKNYPLNVFNSYDVGKEAINNHVDCTLI